MLGARVPRGAPTKEVARVILDRYVGTYHQDNYALGATKVFLREGMEAALEQERQDIQEVEVVKLSRNWREKASGNIWKLPTIMSCGPMRHDNSRVQEALSNL